MMHKILVVLMFFSLLISCSEENVEPEFPTLSQKELDKFLTQETISLSYNNTVWKMSIDDMQANSTNVFINWPVKDSIGLISGLAGNNDDRSFSLYAGAVPFNDDIDVLTKHFVVGPKPIGSHVDDYNISMYDPDRPNSTIELFNIKVVKVSRTTTLYYDVLRKVKVWFLIDFDIIENSSGTVIEKIRNAKYINEFFLIDFNNEILNPVQSRYDKMTTP